MSVVPDPIIGSVTIYSAKVAENFTKDVRPIKIPTSESTAKTTMLLDLLRMEIRYTITGHIVETDKNLLKSYVTQQRILTLQWDGENINVIIDKLEISKDSKEDEYRDVILSCIAGEAIGVSQ